ncbi:MAG: YtxH domain-containing protein, partial [Gemmatimonadales bacterium]|nr:YtxH domain-containing protein [Gemmatimonadales bacterium]
MRRRPGRQVVFVDRGDSSATWLFWGAMLGAGLALMYAPRSGEETRRGLQRSLWKFRAMTEEKLDELTQQFSGARHAFTDEEDEELDDDVLDGGAGNGFASGRAPSAREELERRLADARA